MLFLRMKMMIMIIVTRIKITGSALINQNRVFQLNRKIWLTWTVVLWLVMVNLEEYNSWAATSLLLSLLS